MRLNLGCGSRTLPGWVNVDRVELPGVDLVHNLDLGPWPWPDGSASEIQARDVFEHVDDPILFMTECHRVLQDHKLLQLHTPHFASIDAYTDPTHRRFPTEHTFDYWVPGTVLHRFNNAAYGGVDFELVRLAPDNGSMDVTLRKLPRGDSGSG